MKITVEISEKDMKDVQRFTGVRKKGPAIRKLMANALMMERRREWVNKVLTGKSPPMEFAGFEEGRAADRRRSAERAERWRE